MVRAAQKVRHQAGWVVLCGLWVLLCGGSCSLHLGEMGKRPPARKPWGSFEHLSVVSLNVWRLRERHRVARLFKALQTLGRDLPVAGQGDPLPDLLLFQELEGAAAIAALGQRLKKTHWFGFCVCARKSSGELRSAVGVAVRRSRFLVKGRQCLRLGRLWPDHRRCAMLVPFQNKQRKERLFAASVHLSPLPRNGSQARRLLQKLRQADVLQEPRLIIGGDFNFQPRSGGYKIVTAVLRDPFLRGRGRTHWFGGRLDHLFVGKKIQLLQPLSRWLAYKTIQPGSSLRLSNTCRQQDSPSCPLSDHLPEGGVLRFR